MNSDTQLQIVVVECYSFDLLLGITGKNFEAVLQADKNNFTLSVSIT
jgi:hypothetical protein